jgi:hypothetical protein
MENLIIVVGGLIALLAVFVIGDILAKVFDWE